MFLQCQKESRRGSFWSVVKREEKRSEAEIREKLEVLTTCPEAVAGPGIQVMGIVMEGAGEYFTYQEGWTRFAVDR